MARNPLRRLSNCQSVDRLQRGDATLLYESQATRDARARVKTMSVSLQKRWRPKAGWGVPLAWLTLCVVWSSTWLAIKIGLRDLPPISFVAIRFLIAIIVLVAVSMGRTHLLPRRRNDYVVLAVTGVLMFAVNYTLLFWAELHVSSGLAAVLQATIPIFGMVFAHWMLPDEPLRLPKLAGAIIALGGVTVICARLLGFNGPLAFWGGVAVVVGAASAAFANVLVKARSMQLAPAMLAAWQMIFGTAPLLLLGLVVDGNPVRFHWTASLNVLPALSGCDRLGADVSASLLAAATPDGRAAAKYLAHHSTRSSHARLVVRRRNISALVLVRRCAGSCGSVDDFPKSACARPADSRRVVN